MSTVLGNRYDDQVCSIARTLEHVGERWSLLIMRDAIFAGTTRFGDFQRSLGVATNVLTSRLDAFVASGLMKRQPVRDQPDVFEYVLTEKGRDLTTALVALTEWGDRWSAPDGPPILYRRRETGEPVHAELVVPSGEVDAAEVEIHAGPGMPPEMAAGLPQPRVPD